MKLATFNIRCDYGQDGANNFCFRKPYIVKKIRSEAPDILCFQEVLPHIAAWLKETFPEYCAVGCGRSEGFEDEMALIAFKKERFDLVGVDTFWLSRTPYMPGSRYEEQSICPRTATEAILWDLEEKRLYRVVNTHLDHEGSQAREQGLSQIMERLLHPVNFPEALLLLAGDFNAEPDMPELELIKRYPQFRDAAFLASVCDAHSMHRLLHPDLLCANCWQRAGIQRLFVQKRDLGKPLGGPDPCADNQ